MKSRTRPFRIIVLSLVIALTVTIGAPVVLLFRAHAKAQNRLERLLCETDYHVLLDACRELSERTRRGDLKTGYYWVRRDKDPKASQFQFPQVILDIKPLFVEIDSEGMVRLEMAGWPSLGVIAFPDVPITPSFFGDVELIPGLWYYDEDYNNFHHPQWKKKIDTMIQRGRKVGQGRRLGVSSN